MEPTVTLPVTVWWALLPSRSGVPWSCSTCPDALGEPSHPWSVTPESPLCPSIPENHGVDERSIRGMFFGSHAGTKLVLCHGQCVLCSPLVMPRSHVPHGRGVLCHCNRAT